MQANKYKRKIIISVILFILVLLLFKKLIEFNNSTLQSLYCDLKDDIITISTFIFGLVFTGLTILIGLLDNEKIKRLSKHHYLDDFMFYSIICLSLNIFIIVIHFTNIFFINFKNSLFKYSIAIQFVIFLLMFISFIAITKDIVWVMKVVFKSVDSDDKEKDSAKDIIENNK